MPARRVLLAVSAQELLPWLIETWKGDMAMSQNPGTLGTLKKN